MNRTRVASLGGLVVLTVAAAAWLPSLLSRPDTAAGGAAIVQAPVRAADLPETGLPVAADDAPGRPLTAVSPDATTPGTPGTPDDTPPPGSPRLLLHVVHASGRPASGGRVALHDASPSRLAEGVLDATGSWTHAGVDGPVEVFVLGLTPEPARFDLAPGRGEHELTLPDGAWLDGLVLIDGAPPGRPFPLRLGGSPNEYALFAERGGPPSTARIPGEIASPIRGGGFLTDANGRFMVSGLEPGTELTMSWPRLYHQDAAGPSAFPVTVPASGLVLSLRRPRMIRGRVLTADGQPAPDARLNVELKYERETRPSKPGAPLIAARQTLSFADSAVDGDGRFAIAIGDLSQTPTASVDTTTLQGIHLAVQLVARTPDKSWMRIELPELDVALDHDLGDLVLQPVQRVLLEVVDPDGEPVAAARVRPASQRVLPDSIALDTDAAGRVEIDLAIATEGFATIVAKGFRLEIVPLPRPPPEEPLRIELTRSTSVHLTLRGPWDDDRDPETRDAWRFRLIVSAQDAVYEDSVLSSAQLDDVQHGPDTLREVPEGYTESGGSTIYADGQVEFSWHSRLPEWTFDGLRPRHSLLFEVQVTDCPESFGLPPGGVVWESPGVFLSDGERRELVADLRGLQPGP